MLLQIFRNFEDSPFPSLNCLNFTHFPWKLKIWGLCYNYILLLFCNKFTILFHGKRIQNCWTIHKRALFFTLSTIVLLRHNNLIGKRVHENLDFIFSENMWWKDYFWIISYSRNIADFYVTWNLRFLEFKLNNNS